MTLHQDLQVIQTGLEDLSLSEERKEDLKSFGASSPFALDLVSWRVLVSEELDSGGNESEPSVFVGFDNGLETKTTKKERAEVSERNEEQRERGREKKLAASSP